MLALEFQQSAKMTSGNTRGERHGTDGEGELALDLDFTTEVGSDVLEQLAVGETVDYRKWFWDKDGQVRNLGLKRITFDRVMEDQVLYLNIGEEKFVFDEVTVKKISAEIVFGFRIKLSLQCQTHPKEDVLGPVLQGLVTPQVNIRLRRQEGEDPAEE